MFQTGYLLSELRRRWGRTIVTALGLAIGVGLVIGIIGVSEGLSAAQSSVLSPLSSIGTDILVTRVAGSTDTATGGTGTASTPTGGAGGGGGGFFAGGPGGRNVALNSDAAQSLLAENTNVLTDLSKLGPAGTNFVHDFFLSSTLLTFPEAALTQTATVPGVESVSPGLTQNVQHETGTVPQQVATVTEAAQTFSQTQTVRTQLTPDQRQALQQCLASKGLTFGRGGGGGSTGTASPAPGGGAGGGGGQVFGSGGDSAFAACLPQGQGTANFSFTSPARTIQQIVNPPQTNINNSSYTAAGVDPRDPTQGLVTKSQLVAGSWLPAGTSNDVLLNVSYANQHSYKVGAGLPINGVTYTVSGLVNPTLTGSIADIYFPLSTLQNLSGKSGEITQILVKVNSASSVQAVASRIQALLPGATVVTTASLASQVTGSLVDAKKLTDRLGGALGVIVLISAFVIAMLLTLSSIGKRVREIGTLRAVGWSRGRVVRQILAETIGIGLVGGAIGIGLGYAASLAVRAFSPTLQAAAPGVATFGGSSASQVFGQSTTVAVKNVVVHLTSPVHPVTLLIGVGLAVVGGIIAGGVGALRASRLSPAEALRNLA
ncbi:MAG TPA: FtsX-like permease family protein [Actinomycetota bacterium]|nr:FtsX-like permease family protein [Actinomycetota bacterium]